MRSFFRRCNKKAACNCAVVVKSGNDVILVDICGPSMGKSRRFSIKLFLVGRLTTGTEVISHGGGQTYEVNMDIDSSASYVN